MECFILADIWNAKGHILKSSHLRTIRKFGVDSRCWLDRILYFSAEMSRRNLDFITLGLLLVNNLRNHFLDISALTSRTEQKKNVLIRFVFPFAWPTIVAAKVGKKSVEISFYREQYRSHISGCHHSVISRERSKETGRHWTNSYDSKSNLAKKKVTMSLGIGYTLIFSPIWKG